MEIENQKRRLEIIDQNDFDGGQNKEDLKASLNDEI
jgi:hypothetical protein